MNFKSIIVLTLCVMASSVIHANYTSTELQVVNSNSQFTTKLYKTFLKSTENLIFSPISIHTVLSMAYQGAKGSTAEKFATTLFIPNPKVASDGYSSLIQNFNNIENVTLHLANKFYLMEGTELIPEFQETLTKQFYSTAELINFGDNVVAAKKINEWVEEKTNSKIKNLIGKDDIDASTQLIVLNAIYFKGNWKNKFDKSATALEPFYLNNGETVNVSMMHLKSDFYYKNDSNLDAQLLQLPYTNEKLKMIIILPNKADGLADLEEKLAASPNLNFLTDGFDETEVHVVLPKFKIEQKIDLNDALSQIGLAEIFDSRRANFTGILASKYNQNLFVSKVVQKAFIEVNEEGAEAAAATAVVWITRIGHGYFPVIRVNRPFIFQIVANEPSIVLFQGRIHKPEY